MPPAALEQVLTGTGLAGLGEAFCQAEQEARVNALALVALAAWQSAWGTSRLARELRNLFGWGVGSSGGATTFPSMADAICKVAHLLQTQYLQPGAPYYHGPSLRGLGAHFARDPRWAGGVASVWRQVDEATREARGQ